MTYFLNEKRRAEVIRIMNLDGTHEDCSAIRQFTSDVEDDLDKVDEAMLFHVLAVAKLRAKGSMQSALVGIVCLKLIMEEGMERGLGENDFPRSLQAIKDDLASRGIMNIQ